MPDAPMLAQLGFSAVFLVLLLKVYTDGKADREKMLSMLVDALERLANIENPDRTRPNRDSPGTSK